MRNQELITQTRVPKRAVPKAGLLAAYIQASGRDIDQPEAIDIALNEALESRGITPPVDSDDSDLKPDADAN